MTDDAKTAITVLSKIKVMLDEAITEIFSKNIQTVATDGAQGRVHSCCGVQGVQVPIGANGMQGVDGVPEKIYDATLLSSGSASDFTGMSVPLGSDSSKLVVFVPATDETPPMVIFSGTKWYMRAYSCDGWYYQEIDKPYVVRECQEGKQMSASGG